MRYLLAFPLAVASLAQSLPGDRSITADVEIGDIRFLDGGRSIAGVCRDGKVRVWNSATGAVTRTIEPKGPAMSPFAFVAETGKFGKVGQSGGVDIWDALTGSAAGQIDAGMARPRDLAFSPDGSAMATAHSTMNVNSVQVRNRDGSQRFVAPAGLGGTSILEFSPDGSALIAGSWDADVRVWNARNGELIRLIDELKVGMFASAFSPDGKLLATGGVDRTVYLWDTKTWKLARKLGPVKDMVSAIAFSSDGKILATGGFDDAAAANPAKVHAWDLASGKVIRELTAPRRVAAITVSPDGKAIASASLIKAINVWQVSK